MKKIYSVLLVLAASISFVACTPEVEDYFDKSAAERATELQTETKKILESSQTGWLMRMYGNLDFGGYNVLCKFEGDYVTVMNEIYGADVTAKSHYRLDQSAGTILSFDEYNKLFHYFSDPKNPSGFGTDGKGFKGDLEFRVLQATPDSIVLLGKKQNNRIVMTPAPADWKKYVESVYEMEQKMMQATRYALKVGNVEMVANLEYRCLNATDPATGRITPLPYMVTDKGIELYEAYTLNGKVIKNFAYNDKELWPEGSDNSVTLRPVAVPLNQQLIEGLWYACYSTMGADAQSYWTDSENKFQQYNMTWYVGALGTFAISSELGSHFGLYFGVYMYDPEKSYYGQIVYDSEPIGDDEIKLTETATHVLNGDFFFEYGLDLATPVFTGTFKITTDNIYNPTYLLLTDTANPNRWMQLSRSVVTYPMYK